jgi:hypothetical protein
MRTLFAGVCRLRIRGCMHNPVVVASMNRRPATMEQEPGEKR